MNSSSTIFLTNFLSENLIDDISVNSCRSLHSHQKFRELERSRHIQQNSARRRKFGIFPTRRARRSGGTDCTKQSAYLAEKRINKRLESTDFFSSAGLQHSYLAQDARNSKGGCSVKSSQGQARLAPQATPITDWCWPADQGDGSRNGTRKKFERDEAARGSAATKQIEEQVGVAKADYGDT